MYGFEFSRTSEGLIKFQHNQFDSRNDEGLQMRQNSNNSTLTIDQELYLLRLQLKDIERNQQIMQNQIRQILEKQQETEKYIKKAMLDYVRIRVNGLNKGKNLKNLFENSILILQIRNIVLFNCQKLEKFLYKHWKKANSNQECLCIEEYNNFTLFHQYIIQFLTLRFQIQTFEMKYQNYATHKIKLKVVIGLN